MDIRVARESVENIRGHFHRIFNTAMMAIVEVVNRVNIYYSAHSNPPCSHS